MRIKKILLWWIICMVISASCFFFIFSPFEYSEEKLENEISQINNSFEKIAENKLLPNICNLSIDCCKTTSKKTYIKFNDNKSSESLIQYFVSEFCKEREEFEFKFYDDGFAEIIISKYFTFDNDLLKSTKYLTSYNLNYDKDRDYIYFETNLTPCQKIEIEITDYSKENYKINLKHSDERGRVLNSIILILFIETVLYFIICFAVGFFRHYNKK